MKNELALYRKKTNQLLRAYEHARKSIQKEKQAIAQLRRKITDMQQAQNIVAKVSAAIQERVHQKIAAVVSKCLEAVFDDPYEFQIRFEQKRGKTEASLVFLRDGMELLEPTYEAGVGTIDVASLALRLATLVLTSPRRRPFLALDEPFKNLHGEENRARLCKLLETLSKEMGVQMLIVTQAEDLHIGKCIRICKK